MIIDTLYAAPSQLCCLVKKYRGSHHEEQRSHTGPGQYLGRFPRHTDSDFLIDCVSPMSPANFTQARR